MTIPQSSTSPPPPPPTLTYTNMDLDSLLAQEIEDLNKDTSTKVREAVILDRPDPNAFDYDSSSSSSEDEDSGRGRRLRFLRFKRSPSPHHRGPYYRSYAPGSDDYEDDLAIRDPQLYEITEKNRVIDYEHAGPSTTGTTATVIPTDGNDDDNDNDDRTGEHSLVGRKHRSSSHRRRPAELVFSDVPVTITNPDQIMVQLDYGLSSAHLGKKSRKYLMACDFSEESSYAMEWAMGTLLRSGDVIHVVSVIGLDEDLDDMDEEEKYRLWQELDRNSKLLISKVKSILGHLLLYNIKINIYSIAGQTRESIINLIRTIPLTMVVCGSRGRSALKGMFMGGVSTHLVQKSPVPVSVVRPQKKKKKYTKKLTGAQKLSQSVRDGQLQVDEIEGMHTLSINSHDGY
ncbi:hypothetical protein BCR42DRAFT_425147 [Absidia repens]|uniref:UspA domain-containing protein n=1 Tax=Absidia repens TaxID=90262 RepID=A0A1X2I3E6_9FUNG|nr:hypothetical protein BCR42DRAFT_425147 [Absidia repens]